MCIGRVTFEDHWLFALELGMPRKIAFGHKGKT